MFIRGYVYELQNTFEYLLSYTIQEIFEECLK